MNLGEKNLSPPTGLPGTDYRAVIGGPQLFFFSFVSWYIR